MSSVSILLMSKFVQIIFPVSQFLHSQNQCLEPYDLETTFKVQNTRVFYKLICGKLQGKDNKCISNIFTIIII